MIVNTALPRATQWRFTEPLGAQVTFDAEVQLLVDTSRGVHTAALAGVGFAVLPDFMVAADIDQGRLIRVLPHWRLPSGVIDAAFPSSRLRPTRVSAFVDMLASSMKDTHTRAEPLA